MTVREEGSRDQQWSNIPYWPGGLGKDHYNPARFSGFRTQILKQYFSKMNQKCVLLGNDELRSVYSFEREREREGGDFIVKYLYSIYGVSPPNVFNTLRTGDADLCFYITTVQDG